MDINPQDI